MAQEFETEVVVPKSSDDRVFKMKPIKFPSTRKSTIICDFEAIVKAKAKQLYERRLV